MIWSKGFTNSYSTSEFIEFVGITRDYSNLSDVCRAASALANGL